MYRQSPGRSHRSKRLKTRHVLQICLLLAVGFWLIYQIRHSHGKKKEFDESDDVKASLEGATGGDELLKLGRKDIIRPLVEETDDKISGHDDEAAEEDENKAEEDVEENKIEHNVDDAIEGENEETDEHEREKPDGELDREEEFVDGDDDEKEREENGDNLTEETNSETEKHDSTEESDSDGVDKSAHEAREEHYKADDASSAVSQENSQAKNENEHSKEVEDNNAKDSIVETVKDDRESNVTLTGENGNLVLDSSENGSPPNGTITRVSEDDAARNNSTNAAIENGDLSSLKGNLSETTAAKEASISDVAASEKTNNSSLLHDDNNGLLANSTSQLETKDLSTDTANNTETTTEKNDGTDEGERSDTNGNKIDEILESTDDENRDGEAENDDAVDISDSSNPLEEEMNARTDLDTLPVVENEGINGDNDDDGAAAE